MHAQCIRESQLERNRSKKYERIIRGETDGPDRPVVCRHVGEPHLLESLLAIQFKVLGVCLFSKILHVRPTDKQSCQWLIIT